jgi:hypothetical protein
MWEFLMNLHAGEHLATMVAARAVFWLSAAALKQYEPSLPDWARFALWAWRVR